LLEPGRSRLAILEIRMNAGPALLLRCDGVGHQTRDLHVGRGPQAERILVPVLPGDLVGQRLGRQEEHLLLARELGDREADIGQESTGDDVCPLARDELVGSANRVARIRTIIARDKFKLFAEDTRLGIDLFDCEFPALLVRLEERRLPLVTVELTDLHGVLGDSRGTETDGARCDEPSELESGVHAVLHVLGSALCGREQVVSRHERLSRSLDRAFDTAFSVRPSESGDPASGSGFPLSAGMNGVLLAHHKLRRPPHLRSRRRSISDFSCPPSISIWVPLTMCISGEASMTTSVATSST